MSPDSRFVAVTGINDTHLWDLHDSNPKVVQITASGMLSMAFLSGNRLYLSSEDGWVLYDPRIGRTAALVHAGQLPHGLGAVSGGEYALSTADGEGLTCWRLSVDGDELRRDRVWLHPDEGVRSVLFSPDGQRFLAERWTGGLGFCWTLHRAGDGVRLADFEPRECYLSPQVSFSPDGLTLLASPGSDIYSWDVPGGGPATFKYRDPTGRTFKAIALHPNGSVLAGITGDNAVSFFDATTWELLKIYAWPVKQFRSVQFTPDGTRCVLCTRLGKVLLFDVD